jgi:ArsR family transcriptional regulator
VVDVQRRADGARVELVGKGGELPGPGLSAHGSDAATREFVRVPDWPREADRHRRTVAGRVDEFPQRDVSGWQWLAQWGSRPLSLRCLAYVLSCEVLMPIANAYKALGDATRREILRLLREGDLTAGELAGHFEISWPSVSRHLKVLETAGLITSERRGGHIIYSLRTSVLEDIATEVADMARIGRTPPTLRHRPRSTPRRRPQQA